MDSTNPFHDKQFHYFVASARLWNTTSLEHQGGQVPIIPGKGSDDVGHFEYFELGGIRMFKMTWVNYMIFQSISLSQCMYMCECVSKFNSG